MTDEATIDFQRGQLDNGLFPAVRTGEEALSCGLARRTEEAALCGAKAGSRSANFANASILSERSFYIEFN
jgi:hypothetical protein